MAASSTVQKYRSRVLETPGPDPSTIRQHYVSKLAFETDPSDVYHDLQNGETGFIVIDARLKDDFAEGHIPGAMSLPYRTIDSETTAKLPTDKLLVVYCWSPACNAATKAAVRLAGLGFAVKEMIGGIQYWRREGYPVEGTDPRSERIG